MFLRFTNFYRQFINKYLVIIKPLTNLTKGTKKGKKSRPVNQGPIKEYIFKALKKAFNSAPLLIYFDLLKPIQVKTNISRFMITIILLQPEQWPVESRQKAVQHLVAFFSKKLNQVEANYGTPN